MLISTASKQKKDVHQNDEYDRYLEAGHERKLTLDFETTHRNIQLDKKVKVEL